MTAILLDGAVLAAKLRQQVSARIEALRDAGVVPGLGTILVGDDAPSARYVALKHEDCAALGINSVQRHLPADTDQATLEATISELNDDPIVGAFLVQLPLPGHLDEERALFAVDPDKDVDGLHPVNLGKLVLGHPGLLPCTPAGIVALLAEYEVPVEGRDVVIIGRGVTIGRPLALLLALKRPHCNAAVTVVHTGVSDIGEHVKRADVVVAAAGSPGILKAEMVKPGAAVVGAGLTFEGRRAISDVEDSVAEVAGWITPRLGGVGPMTRVMLMQSTVLAAERRLGG